MCYPTGDPKREPVSNNQFVLITRYSITELFSDGMGHQQNRLPMNTSAGSLYLNSEFVQSEYASRFDRA